MFFYELRVIESLLSKVRVKKLDGLKFLVFYALLERFFSRALMYLFILKIFKFTAEKCVFSGCCLQQHKERAESYCSMVYWF